MYNETTPILKSENYNSENKKEITRNYTKI